MKNNDARRKSQKIAYAGQASGQANKGNNASRPMVYQSLALQSTDNSRTGQLQMITSQKLDRSIVGNSLDVKNIGASPFMTSNPTDVSQLNNSALSMVNTGMLPPKTAGK